MCYFAKCLTFLYVAVVGLMLISQPAWADSKKDNCDAEGGSLRDHRQSPNLTNWAWVSVVAFVRNNWKAALSIENLFNVEYFNGTPLTVLGTVLVF